MARIASATGVPCPTSTSTWRSLDTISSGGCLFWRIVILRLALRSHTAGRTTPKGADQDELLDGEIFYSLREAQIIIESWRRHYNSVRPHASLGYRPPAPEVFVPHFTAWPAAPSRPASPARHPVAPRPTLN